MVFRAQLDTDKHRVVLTGTDIDLDELTGFIAAEANHEPNGPDSAASTTPSNTSTLPSPESPDRHHPANRIVLIPGSSASF